MDDGLYVPQEVKPSFGDGVPVRAIVPAPISTFPHGGSLRVSTVAEFPLEYEVDDGLGRISPNISKMGATVFIAPKSVNPEVDGVATAAVAGCSGGLKLNSHQLLDDLTELNMTFATMVPTP